MSLVKFLHQIRDVDIVGRLPSELFRAITFPVHQIVQAVAHLLGIKNGMHFIFLATMVEAVVRIGQGKGFSM